MKIFTLLLSMNLVFPVYSFDLNENQTATSRPTRNKVWFISTEDNTPVVKRAYCLRGTKRPNRYSCTQSLEKVNLPYFLNNLSPQLAIDLKNIWNHGSDYITTEVIGNEDDATAFSGIKSRHTELSSIMDNLINDDFLNGAKPMLELLSSMINSDVSFCKSGQKVDSSYCEFASRLDRIFDKAQNEQGHPCTREIPNLFTTGKGGCQQNDGLVWSGPMDTGGIEDGFLTRSDAIRHCATIGMGNYFDWRLPSEQDLLSLSASANYIGLSSSLFYWTSENSENEVIKKISEFLGEDGKEATTSKSVNLYTNYYKSDVYYPDGDNYRIESEEKIYDTVSTTVQQLKDLVSGDVTLDLAKEKLVQPHTSKTVFANRWNYKFAEGQFTKRVREEIRKPIYRATQHRTSRPISVIDMGRLGTRLKPGHDFTATVYKKDPGAVDVSHKVHTDSTAVDPLAYVQYHLPEQTYQRIGLTCVRGGEKRQVLAPIENKGDK